MEYTFAIFSIWGCEVAVRWWTRVLTLVIAYVFDTCESGVRLGFSKIITRITDIGITIFPVKSYYPKNEDVLEIPSQWKYSDPDGITWGGFYQQGSVYELSILIFISFVLVDAHQWRTMIEPNLTKCGFCNIQASLCCSVKRNVTTDVLMWPRRFTNLTAWWIVDCECIVYSEATLERTSHKDPQT